MPHTPRNESMPKACCRKEDSRLVLPTWTSNAAVLVGLSWSLCSPRSSQKWLKERPQKKSIYFPMSPRLLFHCLIENLKVFPTLTKALGWAALPGSQWLCWCWRPCTNWFVGLNFLLWDEHKHFVAEELSSAAFHLPPNPPGREDNLGAEDPKPIVLTDGTQPLMERGLRDHFLRHHKFGGSWYKKLFSFINLSLLAPYSEDKWWAFL